MRTELTSIERYLGAESDVVCIRGTLLELRRQSLTPNFVQEHLQHVKQIAKMPAINSWLLSEFLAKRPLTHFDYVFFERAAAIATDRIRASHPLFNPLPLASYVVAEAEGRGNPGGFFGRFGIGFQYESHFAFSELLDPAAVSDGRVRALELARNYIHDSFHAATFRSFGYFDNRVFRYQYGINFRLPSGTSYSRAQTPYGLPFVVNLNALMDGITALIAAEAMAEPAAEVVADNNRTREIVFEVTGNYAQVRDLEMLRFAQGVVFPAKEFVDYWGGGVLGHTIGEAMLRGDLEPFKRAISMIFPEKAQDRALAEYLEARRLEFAFLGRNLWEDLFLSGDFHCAVGAYPALRRLGS